MCTHSKPCRIFPAKLSPTFTYTSDLKLTLPPFWDALIVSAARHKYFKNYKMQPVVVKVNARNSQRWRPRDMLSNSLQSYLFMALLKIMTYRTVQNRTDNHWSTAISHYILLQRFYILTCKHAIPCKKLRSSCFICHEMKTCHNLKLSDSTIQMGEQIKL